MKRTLKHFTNEELLSIVKESKSWADFCRRLGITPMTGSQTHLKKRCTKIEGFTWDHFTPQSGKGIPRKKIDINLYLTNQRNIGSSMLRIRLIQENLKENKCEMCGLEKWLEENIPLELDHIDSNHFNNSIENLQIICANCHAIVTKKRQKDKSVCYKSEKRARIKREKIKIVRPTKIQWPSDEELKRLVWEMPTTALAKHLGVSDNAVGKRCKKLGITKPEPGYWAKVQHGHTP